MTRSSPVIDTWAEAYGLMVPSADEKTITLPMFALIAKYTSRIGRNCQRLLSSSYAWTQRNYMGIKHLEIFSFFACTGYELELFSDLS